MWYISDERDDSKESPEEDTGEHNGFMECPSWLGKGDGSPWDSGDEGGECGEALEDGEEQLQIPGEELPLKSEFLGGEREKLCEAGMDLEEVRLGHRS
ncbi:hypothetical protein P7K49_034541 [Saguinus oedipus]|uniref:Uncharacterized protein n=1 Tax=Saguinus oedipus TaxID=9490 RepID=A0ABQ9TV30_SAGOE|nr:hypothetical protein P7K49_034541 [Saguinus oedipus]